MYLTFLNLLCLCQVLTIYVLYCAHHCIKCSLSVTHIFLILFLLENNYNIMMFFSYISTWISHKCSCVTPSWTPLLPPSHPIPLGCHRAPALGALLHASVSHWPSVLHMVIYMFQCYSLKSSHPLLLPLSPKVCSLRLCLLCCPVGRILGIILLLLLLLSHFSRVRLCATP